MLSTSANSLGVPAYAGPVSFLFLRRQKKKAAAPSKRAPTPTPTPTPIAVVFEELLSSSSPLVLEAVFGDPVVDADEDATPVFVADTLAVALEVAV